MYCNQRTCVFVVPVHVLLGFQIFLLEQWVLLSVEHLETSRTLNEWMKHLLGKYYAKPWYYYLLVEALSRFDWTCFITRKEIKKGVGVHKMTSVIIPDIVEHFVSISIMLISNNNTKFIKGIIDSLWGTKAKLLFTLKINIWAHFLYWIAVETLRSS